MIRLMMGVRGCGKTTRLLGMMGEGDAYVDGEAGGEFPRAASGRVFVDEPQAIAGWEGEVERLGAGGCEVIAASSSLHSAPAGALEELVMPPTFREWLALRGVDLDDAPPGAWHQAAHGLLGEYLVYGGLAELAGQSASQAQHHAYCSQLFLDIVVRDVLGRGSVEARRQLTSPELVRMICEFLAGCVGNGNSANNMVRMFEGQGMCVANDTAGAYIDELCTSQLFWAMPRYDICSKKVLKTLGRHYMIDNGLLSYLTGYCSDEAACWRALKNAVFLEALHSGLDAYVGKFRKDEVDFMFECDGRRAYVQVAHSIENPVVSDEVLRPLRRIPDPWPKIAVVGVGEYPERVDGARVVPAVEFLLDPVPWVVGELR